MSYMIFTGQENVSNTFKISTFMYQVIYILYPNSYPCYRKSYLIFWEQLRMYLELWVWILSWNLYLYSFKLYYYNLLVYYGVVREGWSGGGGCSHHSPWNFKHIKNLQCKVTENKNRPWTPTPWKTKLSFILGAPPPPLLSKNLWIPA